MQYFLIGPDIGGLNMTLGAAVYLDLTLKPGLLGDIGYAPGSDGSMVDICKTAAIHTTEGGDVLFRVGAMDMELNESNMESRFPIASQWLRDSGISVDSGCKWDATCHPGPALRDRALPAVRGLDGEYDDLDTLNSGSNIRFVAVPAGVSAHVTSAPDYGFEYVEEDHRAWRTEYDCVVRARAAIMNYIGAGNWEDARVDGLSIVFGKDYALAGVDLPVGNPLNGTEAIYYLLRHNIYYGGQGRWEFAGELRHASMTVRATYLSQEAFMEIADLFKRIAELRTESENEQQQQAEEMMETNNAMTIKVKYLDGEVTRLAKIDKGDWIDLYAAETVELKAGEMKLVHLGVAMKLPDGYEGHLAPRSSTFKKWGIIQANSVGVVDNSYCGDNDWWRFPALAMRDTVISRGDKICQFRIVEKQPNICFAEVEELGEADRGGFGSTGTR